MQHRLFTDFTPGCIVGHKVILFKGFDLNWADGANKIGLFGLHDK